MTEEVNSVSNNEKDFSENEGINNANFIQNYKKTSATNLSSWFANIGKPLKFQKLNKNISVDVAIVGGGIAGLSTAYILSRTGKSVAVLDDGYLGSGETGHTTAHITHALDDRYFNLEKIFGIEGAILAAESHTNAINFIETVVSEEEIDCDFERLDGYLFLGPGDDEKTLYKELEATHRVGIKTELVLKTPLTPFDRDIGPGLRFPNQAQFHPLKYLKGLSKSILNKNGNIFTETHVQEISNSYVMTSDGFKVEAKHIVIATNAPIVDKISKIYEKQIPYRTYVIGARIRKGSVPKGLYWDTGDKESKTTIQPYHYVRIQKLEKKSDLLYTANNIDNELKPKANNNNSNKDDDYEILIVGGEDHKTGNEDDIEERHDRLESWAKQRFPIEDVLYRWSGQVMEPIDSLAFIGLNPINEKETNNNIYIATGDSGNGMTHGTIAGILLSDIILEKRNEWSWLYNPSRTTRNTNKNENEKDDNRSSEENNSNKSKSPEDHPTSINKFQSKSKVESLSISEGAIIEQDPENPIAIYKDKNGQIHTFSAKCTHLGCTLTWNSLEQSFDCPCHGSRFFNNGKVINGPANSELERR